jgi:hypothetical protein
MSRRKSTTTNKRVSGTYRSPRLKDSECRRLENLIKTIEERIDMLQKLIASFFVEADKLMKLNKLKRVESTFLAIDTLKESVRGLYDEFMDVELQIEARIKNRRAQYFAS